MGSPVRLVGKVMEVGKPRQGRMPRERGVDLGRENRCGGLEVRKVMRSVTPLFFLHSQAQREGKQADWECRPIGLEVRMVKAGSKTLSGPGRWQTGRLGV